MRVGPFSDKNIISLLNDYFIPAYITNEDYINTPKAKQLNDIWTNAHEQGLPSGTVHAYIVRPDRTVINSIHVDKAQYTKNFGPFLGQVVRDLGLSPQKPVVEPKPQSVAPEHDTDELVLRLRTDYSRRRGRPTENWLVLKPAEWNAFLPRDTATTWEVSPAVTKKLLMHVYPSTEDWDSEKNEIIRCKLTASRSADSAESNRVVLRGHIEMRHNRGSRGNPQRVSAEIVGTVEMGTHRVPTLTITSGTATYGGEPFDALFTTENAFSVD